MESKHFFFEEAEKPPDFGSKEYFKQLEDKIEQRLLEEQDTNQYDKELWGEGYQDIDLWAN
jgi:hypothetical protein